jgi:HicB family
MRQAGRALPPPTAEATEAYSGKWVVRMPKSLHRGLAERAREEGVSLNTLAIAMLARGLGQGSEREGQRRAGQRSRINAGKGAASGIARRGSLG